MHLRAWSRGSLRHAPGATTTTLCQDASRWESVGSEEDRSTEDINGTNTKPAHATTEVPPLRPSSAAAHCSYRPAAHHARSFASARQNIKRSRRTDYRFDRFRSLYKTCTQGASAP